MTEGNFLCFIQIFTLLCPLGGTVVTQPPYPEEYRNLRFWDQNLDYCFHNQSTNVTCVPAAVQMVLLYLNLSPLPNQSQLAHEMKTDINHTTDWKCAHIPFDTRRFDDYYNESLSSNFHEALSRLKGNISRNFPAILITWYDEIAKENRTITHARVVTGYNSTSVFLHDPWTEPPYTGPNIFLSNSVFEDLWETDYGFWVLIVKHEPTFDLLIEVSDILGSPIPNANVTLTNRIGQSILTDTEGRAKFHGIPVSSYSLEVRWRFDTEEDIVRLTDDTTRSYHLVSSDQAIVLLFVILVVIPASALIYFIIMTRRRRCAN